MEPYASKLDIIKHSYCGHGLQMTLTKESDVCGWTTKLCLTDRFSGGTDSEDAESSEGSSGSNISMPTPHIYEPSHVVLRQTVLLSIDDFEDRLSKLTYSP